MTIIQGIGMLPLDGVRIKPLFRWIQYWEQLQKLKKFNYRIMSWSNMTRAIVLGGSRGMGKAISESLKSIGIDVFAASKNDIDTSNLDSVKKFVKIHNQTDVLVLNTGGPTAKEFASITEEEWNRYHNQLFLEFCIIYQIIKITIEGS